MTAKNNPPVAPLRRNRALLTFANLPLSLKFMMTPCLALIAFGLCFFVAAKHISDQVRITENIANTQLSQMHLIASLSEDISRINFSVFHRLTVSAMYQVQNGDSVPKLIENVAALRLRAEQLQKDFYRPERWAMLNAALIGLDAYGDTLRLLNKKLDISYEAAVGTLPKFDHLHGLLQSRFQQLTQSIVKDSQLMAHEAAQLSREDNQRFLLIFSLAFVIIFLLSLVVARNTARSITDIAEATHALAGGNLDIDIQRLRRRDELGAVVESLHTFRDHIRQLEAAHHAKNDFLAHMSHELRTPLNSIIGMSDLILDEEQDKQKREMLEVLLTSSGNLLTIINDILDISKIESGKVVLESTPFVVLEAVTRSFSPLQAMASSRGLLLSKSVTIPENLTVLGDPLRVESILTNLLGNAVKYTPKGSVHLTVSHRQLDAGLVEICFNVKDTGIGIAAEKLEGIFDKFTQADVSTTRKYGGTGLGLAITKSLTEMMGGAIMVESQPMLGSTFIVTIPFPTAAMQISCALDRVAECEAGGNSNQLVPLAQARILLAEDHPMNQAYMKKLLSSYGVSYLRIAENGQLALQALEEEKFDIVLMDCHMPLLNGYDSTMAIRRKELESGGHIPIVAMTANAMAGERERCLECGMDDYISKPVSKATFRKIVSRWIDFGAAPVVAAKTTAADMPPALDLTALHEQAGHDPAIERQFVSIFMQQSEEILRNLEVQCGSNDNRTWTEQLQHLKGGAATIGAMRLRALCVRAQESKEACENDRRQILAFIKDAYSEAVQNLKDAELV